MQVCTSLQTDNHASTSPLSFFTGRMLFLLSSQQCKSTEGKEYKVNEEQTAGKSFVISATDLLLLPVLLDLHALCAWFCSLL